MKDNLRKLDNKLVQSILIRENKFLSELFSIVPVPSHEQEEEGTKHVHTVPLVQSNQRFCFFTDEDKDEETIRTEPLLKPQATSRAKSITELQERLQAIQSKKKLTYKEKLIKKGLKNRMKKKSKQDERNAKQKLLRAAKEMNKQEVQAEEKTVNETQPKVVFNSDDKMVFSKFDFSDIGKKVKKKEENDPKKLLAKLKEQKEKLIQMEQSGEKDKAIEIKEKIHWKNALAKAEGKKVKDDPTLLKKTIQKEKYKVNKSKKEWEARQEGVKKAKEERQKKRTENIEKRKKDKKLKKLKNAAKKGKIIPGF